MKFWHIKGHSSGKNLGNMTFKNPRLDLVYIKFDENVNTFSRY